MIHFTKVKYKNLQSIGNTPMTIDLDRSATTLIGGSNGTGKSTLFIAIVYSLYGKFLNGVTLAEAINTINKKALSTEIEFKRNGDEWRVLRGEKPKKFEIYKNGELQDQYANARDQQKYLDMILGMDFKMFTQLVVLNKERYVPFMELTAAERRKVVEDILDIGVFSVMNDIQKQDIKDLNTEIKNTETQRAVITTNITAKQSVIDFIKNKNDKIADDHQGEIDAIQLELDELLEVVSGDETEYDNLLLDSVRSNIKSLNAISAEYNAIAIQFDVKIKQNDDVLSFYKDNDSCPTCEQALDPVTKSHKIKGAEASNVEINEACESLCTELEANHAEKDKQQDIIDKATKLKNKITIDKSSIRILENQIKTLNNKMNAAVVNDEQERVDAELQMKELQDELDVLTNYLNDCYTTLDMQKDVSGMISDTGIKSKIISEYMGLINRKINEYLNSMNFYIGMKLDENFKESFSAMNKENFSYSNLSTGQKTRVNLSIWLALVEVGSVKNSVSTNLCALDEILEAVDEAGVTDVMNLFRERLTHKNIYVVTQRFKEFETNFQSSIQFELDEGFTVISK